MSICSPMLLGKNKQNKQYCCNVFYYNVLYYTALYYTVMYCTALYCTKTSQITTTKNCKWMQKLYKHGARTPYDKLLTFSNTAIGQSASQSIPSDLSSDSGSNCDENPACTVQYCKVQSNHSKT